MSRIHSRSYGGWSLDITRRELPFRSAAPGSLAAYYGPPECTLEMTVTFEQAQQLLELYGHDYNRRPIRISQNVYDSGAKIQMDVTEAEAEQIRAGADPHDVLLGPQGKYRLIVVPWTPAP